RPAPPVRAPVPGPGATRRDSRRSTVASRTIGRVARSIPACPLGVSCAVPSEGGLGFPGQDRQFFFRVELQHELTNLRSQLAHLGLMRRLLVLGPRLESTLPCLDERVHPPLDLGLLEVVLAAHVHELPLPS